MVNKRQETDAEHIARDMREGRFPKRSPRQFTDAKPRVLGVFRDPENEQVVMVSFSAPLSDDELRAFHDGIREPNDDVSDPEGDGTHPNQMGPWS